MKTKTKAFQDLMKDPEIKQWYDERPDVIKKLIRTYPYDRYVIKKGAPYALTVPGQKVTLHSYMENKNTGVPTVKVIIMAKDKLPQVIEHEKKLFRLFSKEKILRMHATNILVEIDPKWLKPI